MQWRQIDRDNLFITYISSKLPHGVPVKNSHFTRLSRIKGSWPHFQGVAISGVYNPGFLLLCPLRWADQSFFNPLIVRFGFSLSPASSRVLQGLDLSAVLSLLIFNFPGVISGVSKNLDPSLDCHSIKEANKMWGSIMLSSLHDSVLKFVAALVRFMITSFLILLASNNWTRF